jgi:chitin synthase
MDKSASNRLPGSNMSHYGGQPTLSQYGLPQVPFMPFGGGPGSVTGSEYGQMPMAVPYQHTGSVYGMMPSMPMAPRNTVMSLNMLGNTSGSQAGDFAPPMAPGMQAGRPMSTFSMATSVNPFATPSPSMNPNPSDEELVSALRQYLSTQDLMTVTKK